MRSAIILAAGLLASSSALAFTQPNVFATATACKVKGDDMGRKSDRADAWQWFCMEQNHFTFSASCTYSPPAIYKPECWVVRPPIWPTAENSK